MAVIKRLDQKKRKNGGKDKKTVDKNMESYHKK